MGAMPFGSISVCKLEAADEGRRVRRRWKKEARGEKEGANSASGSHWPACQGQRPQRRPLPSWHPPGVCTSIAPGAALTINILNFFKMQKPHQQIRDCWIFLRSNFLHFFRVVCIWGGWLWPQWVGGKGWASGASSPAPGLPPPRQQPGLYRGWHANPPTLLPLLNNQPDRRATRPGQPAMFVLARLQWPALFTCLPLAATSWQAHAALPVNKTILARGTLPLNKASQW